MRKHYDCGIDLGETTACIAVPDDDRGYRIIENKVDRLLTTPCAVSITRTGRVIAGLRAANSMNPEDLALLFRKHMGTDKVFQFPALGIQKSPEELSSYILSSLYSNASHSVNAQIKDAVITVPASFTSLQSDATVRAGKAAGFRNILLLPEPIAVLYAYGLHTDPTNRKWMVINCGKSCFTVDIVSSQDIQISIVSSEETDRFSDDAIARLLCRKIIFPALNDEGYTLTSLTNENSPVGKAFLRKIHQECEHCTDALINNAATSFELFDIEDDLVDQKINMR